MLISKLPDTYKVGDTSLILGKCELIDPVFLGRLARLAEVLKTQIRVTEGFRSYATQAMYYEEYLQYKKTGKVGKHGIKLASPAGYSLHEYHLAVDTSTPIIRALLNTQLKPFGLIKPIASEPWHIQPIEITKGQATASIIDKYQPLEGEKMNTKIIADGKPVQVEAINVNGTNYIKLRDVDKLTDKMGKPTAVSYNSKERCPEIKWKDPNAV